MAIIRPDVSILEQVHERLDASLEELTRLLVSDEVVSALVSGDEKEFRRRYRAAQKKFNDLLDVRVAMLLADMNHAQLSLSDGNWLVVGDEPRWCERCRSGLAWCLLFGVKAQGRHKRTGLSLCQRCAGEFAARARGDVGAQWVRRHVPERREAV